MSALVLLIGVGVMRRIIFYIISFCVGGTLLAFELLNVKLIAPHFGHSFYVWSSTIGTTMLGLVVGYFCSEKLIESKRNLGNVVFWLLLTLGGYILLVPYYSGFVLSSLIDFEVLLGVVLATTLFNFPLFALFGLFSPLIIELLTAEAKRAGTMSGMVYALSGLGGVIFLIITGVWLLPSIGLKITIFGLGIMQLLLAMGLKISGTDREK